MNFDNRQLQQNPPEGNCCTGNFKCRYCCWGTGNGNQTQATYKVMIN